MLHINKPRQFNYNPRYYKPEDEEPEKRIQFKRLRKSDVPGRMSPLRLVLFLVIVVLFIIFLQRNMSGLFNNQPTTITLEEIEVID